MQRVTAKSAASRLRGAFVLALLAGTLGIAFGWFVEKLGSYALSWIPTMMVPLAAMFGYVYAAYRTDPDDLATEAFADSVYYLGFLFTLIALTFSLLTITEGGVDTRGLVYRFGAALVTTVVGLSVRIYLVNFRFSAEDDFAKLENQIGRSAEALRARFDQLSRSMTMQQEAFEASLAKAIADVDGVSAELKGAAGRFTSAADSSAGTFAGALEDASRTVSGTADSAVSAAQSSIDSVLSAASEIAKGFESALRESLDRVARAVETGSSGIEAAAATFREKVVQAQLPADVFVAQLQRPLSDLRDHLEQQSRLIKDWLERNAQLGADAERMVRALSNAAGAATRLAGSSLEGVEETGSAIGTLASRIQGIGETFRGLAEEYARYKQVVADHVSATAGMTSQLDEEVKTAQRHRADLESQLSEARAAVRKVHDELVEAARFVRDELRT